MSGEWKELVTVGGRILRRRIEDGRKQPPVRWVTKDRKNYNATQPSSLSNIVVRRYDVIVAVRYRRRGKLSKASWWEQGRDEKGAIKGHAPRRRGRSNQDPRGVTYHLENKYPIHRTVHIYIYLCIPTWPYKQYIVISAYVLNLNLVQ